MITQKSLDFFKRRSSTPDILSDADSLASKPRPQASPTHYAFLDGVRGLSALYVVAYHCWVLSFFTRMHHVPRWFHIVYFLRFGHSAVTVFIVLSGFCLMLPLAKSNSDTIPRGNADFIFRRARRILPPYYAALFFTALLVILVPRIMTIQPGDQGGLFDSTHFTASIVYHVFLVHNLINSQALSIDPPMWSVAAEWQIYFLLPFVFLPLRKRVGILSPIILGLVIGIAAIKAGMLWAHWYYAAAFACGMAGVEIALADRWSYIRSSKYLGPVTGLLLLMAAALIVAVKTENKPYAECIVDTLSSIGIAGVLAFFTILAKDPDRVAPAARLALKFFSHPALVSLGSFSYSLYLLHQPLLSVLNEMLVTRGMGTVKVFAVLIVVGIPMVLGMAYLFHLVFERPFLNAKLPVKQIEKA